MPEGEAGEAAAGERGEGQKRRSGPQQRQIARGLRLTARTVGPILSKPRGLRRFGAEEGHALAHLSLLC